MSGSVLLVGVWGFPGSWVLERYVPPLPPGDVAGWGKLSRWDAGEPVESHSSLAALAAALADAGWDVRVVVYVLDTLAAPPRVDLKKFEGDDVGSRLARELNGLIEEFCKRSPEGYGDIVYRARQVARLYVDGFMGEVGFDSNRVTVHVVPGVGDFVLGHSCAYYRFKGSPQNTLAGMELHLFKTLREMEPDAVILDISHGINYMQVLTFEAARWAIKVYSALADRKVGAAIVNSDPPSSGSSRQELMIHLVDARVVQRRPLEALRSVASKVLNSVGGGSKFYKMLYKVKPYKKLVELDEKLGSIVENRSATVGALLKATDYGLTLYMIQRLLTLEPRELREEACSIENMLREILERNVELGNSVITVSYTYSLNTPAILDTIYILHLLAAIAERAEYLVENINGYTMVDTRLLKEYANNMGLHDPARTLLDKEIYDLKRRVKLYIKTTGEKLEQPTPYAKIYEALEAKALSLLDEENRKRLLKELDNIAKRNRCNIDKRNFYAHAGFERNAIAIAVREGRVLIGYHPDCLEELNRLIT